MTISHRVATSILRGILRALKSRQIIFFLFALFAGGLRAQDAWFAVPQNVTTQNLWSIAYANRTLVACGEQGTILTYNYAAFGDGQAWLPSLSGTAVWLVGVGFGNGRFVVVGDRGTILTSDDNGLTWTSRDSGTTTRLNAAAYGNGRWLVVGEQGTLLTSTDGTMWSTRPALGSGFLRALAFGRGQFLLGGAGGALYSTADAVTFTLLSFGTTSNIEGAAISPGHFFIVGSNGLRASATSLGSWIFGNARPETIRGVTVRNAEEASAVGEAASDTFLLTPTGGLWLGNFIPLKFLATSVVQGENEVVAVGFGGTIASSRMDAPAWLASDLPAIYGRDVHFSLITGSALTSVQWTRNGVDVTGATQSTFVIPNVTPALAGNIGVRFTTAQGGGNIGGGTGGAPFSVLPAGRPEVRDPNFVSALPNLPTVVVPQPDGKILVAGTFTAPLTTGATYGLARLNADGSFDQKFRAGTGIPTSSSITAIQLLVDGRMYVRGSFTSIAGQARPGLARLLANGAVDSTFNPPSSFSSGTITNSTVSPDNRLCIETTDPSQNLTIQRLALDGSLDVGFSPPGRNKLIGIDSRGRVLAAKFDPTNYPGFSGSLVRYLADGTPDSSYTATGVMIFGVSSFDLTSTVVTDSGLYAKSSTGRISRTYFYTRFKPDGGLDSSYQSPPKAQDFDYSSPYRSDGALWFVSPGNRSSSSYTTTFYGPNGALDPGTYATLPDTSNYRIVAFLPDGGLLATHLDSTQQSLIRIRPITGATGRLTNLSVRAFIPSASDPLIAGFVTSGSGTTSALIRGIGPGLLQFNVPDAMADPRLSFTRDGATVTTNDNWDAALAPRFTSVAAFPLASGSKDAALESIVAAGNYTAIVTPAPGDRGTGLVELYESASGPRAPRRFINVSARGSVTNSQPLIVGFNITGDVPLKVLIRGAGPALEKFGVTGTLADPQLALYRASSQLWENDNWSATSDFTSVLDAATRAGAFQFDSGSKDAAMLVMLAPGSYTAVVNGASSTSGTALIEVYEAP